MNATERGIKAGAAVGSVLNKTGVKIADATKQSASGVKHGAVATKDFARGFWKSLAANIKNPQLEAPKQERTFSRPEERVINVESIIIIRK